MSDATQDQWRVIVMAKEIDTTIPAFLDRKLSEEERAAAASKLPKPTTRPPVQCEPTWEDRLELGRAKDHEVAALFGVVHEQRERENKVSTDSFTPEQKERARLRRKLKKFKPKMANDAAAKPRRRRRR